MHNGRHVLQTTSSIAHLQGPNLNQTPPLLLLQQHMVEMLLPLLLQVLQQHLKVVVATLNLQLLQASVRVSR